MKSATRYRSILLLLALLLMTAMALGAGAAGEAGNAQTTAEGVKLREKPDTESMMLYELPINTTVEVLGEESGWYRVLYNGVVGYIRQDYLFLESTGTRAAYVLEDGVALRGAPDQTAYVVETLTAGKGVKVKQLLGEWYFTVVDDQCGYVHRSYLTLTKGTAATASLLRVGMQGQDVKKLQEALYKRGFLSKADITALYGSKTRTAVAEFQKAASLSSADGIAGAETLAAIYDSKNEVRKDNATYNQIKGTVVLLDWFKGGNEWLARYSRFTVTDVKTGLSWKVRRFGGWYHADCEPVTAADTAIMKRARGGVWSWDRRAIWVTYNGKSVAASMNGMPHMVDPTKNNNFDGHFCIHLLNSKVHETSRECPRHQAMVQEAYRKGRAS